jgi:hypothetical protein
MSPAISTRQKSRFTFRLANFGFLLLFCIISIQNLCAIVLSNFSYTFAEAMVAVKDAYLYLILLLFACSIGWRLCKFRIKYACAEDVLIFLATVYFIVGYVISPFRNLSSFRQLMIIPLFYAFGRFFASRVDFSCIKKAIFLIMILVCFSGYIERFVLFDQQESFWNLAGIGEYMKMKGMERWSFGSYGTPGSFYTIDFSGFGNITQLRRMTSLFFAEPTIFGQFLVMPILYCIFAKKRLLVLFFLGALLAAISKGGILAVLFALICYYIQNKRSTIVGAVLLVGAIVFTVGIGYLAFFTSSFASVAVHLVGLAKNIMDLIQYPFGRGVGSAGNWAVLASYSNESIGEVGSGESYLGTVIGQLGFVGLLFYGLLFYYVWRKKMINDDPFLFAVKYSILATLVSGIGSESAISYVGTGYLFALLPFLLVRIRRPLAL